MLRSGILSLVLFLFSSSVSFADIWEDELPLIAKSEAQVLFFGDSHSSEFHKNAFRELFTALKQNSNAWDCIAMEMDPVWVQKPISQVKEGTLPHAELASAIFGSLPESIRSSYDHEFFNEYVERFFPESFFKTLSSTNARFFAIDLPKTEHYIRRIKAFPNLMQGEIPTDEQWDERNRLQLVERNREMANRITGLLTSGQCSQVLVMVGSEHITQSGRLLVSHEPVLSLPQLLKNQWRVESVVIFFDQEEKSKYSRFLTPSARTSMLEQLPISEITYTPTISRW